MQPFIGITKCGWKKQHLKCLTLGWIAPSSPKSLVCGWKAMASSIAIKTMFGLESPSTWMPMHTATWHIHMLIPRSCVHPKPHRIVCQNTMAPAMSSLKRPASSLKQKAGSHSQAAKKRPAAKERKPDEDVEVPQEKEEQEELEEEKQTEDPEVDTPKLTKKALKDHNKFLEAASNMNEKKFMEALSKLEPKAAQKLWKKFQNSRKAANCEDEYQDVMKHSAGSLERKRKLLFQWVQNDKSCGDRYREYMEKVSLVKSDGVKQKWLTSQQALGTWGKEELWSRVQAGEPKWIVASAFCLKLATICFCLPGILGKADFFAEEKFDGQGWMWHCDGPGTASLEGCKALEDQAQQSPESLMDKHSSLKGWKKASLWATGLTLGWTALADKGWRASLFCWIWAGEPLFPLDSFWAG